MRKESGIGLACAVVALAIWLSPAKTLSADNPKPLRESEIVELLTGDVPSSRIAVLVKERGISFELTSESESKIRGAGGTQELIDALREVSKHKTEAEQPRVMVLNIQTDPGEAQVYVNDEFKGTTSPEGRLRLPNLPSGNYKLRVSLQGYQSWEKDLSLTAGEDQTVFVTMVQKPAEKRVEALTNRMRRPANEAGGIPIPNVKVDSIRFFEAGYDAPPKNERVYQTRFPRRTSRYIYWELNLNHPSVTSRINFSIDAVWYGPRGNVVWRQTKEAYVEAGWDNSYHVYGWGCQQPPCNDFQKGSYHVDLIVGGRNVASGTFEMY